MTHQTDTYPCIEPSRHGDHCPATWAACSCGWAAEYSSAPAATAAAERHERGQQ